MQQLPVIRKSRDWASGKTGRRADRSFRARVLSQSIFALASVLMGVQVVRFYRGALAADLPLPSRPPGVEAYLPISGLMGLLDWIYQGTLNNIHPAATILVLVALGMAILLRKAFCSWVCPVGFLSDLLARFGRWSFGRNFRPWKWVDVPLRSLKYLLLLFFLTAILSMSPADLQAFIQSPYNKVADVKMGLFFVELSRTGIVVMGLLALASVFVKGAWCRYLCPYGAFLGLFSWASPARVGRNRDLCVDCGLCDRACMARLPVSGKDRIVSPECTGCMDCVAACPIPKALEMQLPRRRQVSPLVMAGAVAGLFLAGYLGARVVGVWDNGIPDEEYVERLQNIHSPVYGHPGR